MRVGTHPDLRLGHLLLLQPIRTYLFLVSDWHLPCEECQRVKKSRIGVRTLGQEEVEVWKNLELRDVRPTGRMSGRFLAIFKGMTPSLAMVENALGGFAHVSTGGSQG